MPEPLVINSQIVIPAQELRFTFARSSGPGGQNVNKLNTKANLRWDVAQTTALPASVLSRFRGRYANRLTAEEELVLSSDRHREQARNIRDCLEKLRAMIQSVLARPRQRKPTRPTRGSIEARLKQKRKRSQRKQDRRPPSIDS